jgi:two-component system, OmpR family, sensor histidine kinase VanS
MILSVRSKLFITISSIVLFFVTISWGLTKLCLENYYLWQKKDVLIATSKMIDDLYNGNPEAISIDLKRFSNSLGAGIIISGLEEQIKYSSFGPFLPSKTGETTIPPSPPPPPPHVARSKEIIDARTVLEMQSDPAIKIDFMVIDRMLRNGDRLNIRQPLAPISESASVAAQFMILTGVLSLFVGCLWAFLFAKRFTRPILDLNHIAQRMALLDFSQKAAIERNDEIGKLGQSINHLSDQLDDAISELSEKNKQLQADVDTERQLDKMRKEFISNVSHELKTPLSLILGYAEGLKENVPQDDQSRNYYCSVIIDEAERMDRLVHDLLNLSQIESGFFNLLLTDFDLSALIADVLQKYHTILAERNILLNTHIPADCRVQGDQLRIEQILFNYINNAIEHAEGARQLEISVTETKSHFRVSVYNSGRHIPSESLSKIWASFYKIDKARTREYGGHGLGLSIVRAIQELHENSYGVENLEDGVRFWFEINKAANM